MKGDDTHKDSYSFCIGPTVVVQCEDGGPWMCSAVEEMNDTNHQGWSYIIRVTKTGRQIMCNIGHIDSILITTAQYPWEQNTKGTG